MGTLDRTLIRADIFEARRFTQWPQVATNSGWTAGQDGLDFKRRQRVHRKRLFLKPDLKRHTLDQLTRYCRVCNSNAMSYAFSEPCIHSISLAVSTDWKIHRVPKNVTVIHLCVGRTACRIKLNFVWMVLDRTIGNHHVLSACWMKIGFCCLYAWCWKVPLKKEHTFARLFLRLYLCIGWAHFGPTPPWCQCQPVAYHKGFPETWPFDLLTFALCPLSPQLTPGGKAAQAGVGVGDMVMSIADSNAEEMTHVEAQNMIRAATDSLTLSLHRWHTSNTRAVLLRSKPGSFKSSSDSRLFY